MPVPRNPTTPAGSRCTADTGAWHADAPPKPSTDQGAGRRVQREVAQLTRALADLGPVDIDGLRAAVPF